MKLKVWLILGTTISTTVLAQQATNAPAPVDVTPATMAPAMEPVATNKPAAKPARKKARVVKKAVAKKTAKPAVELKTTPLVAGPAVVSANHVNVRTRPGLGGEVISHFTNGEPVTVIEEITLKHSGPEEPSAWAKIALPVSAFAWVKTSYIDEATKTVTPKKLNLRGGPGENYGLLGQLQKGDAVTVVDTKGEWSKIAPPAGAYAFVAAQYLTQGPEAGLLTGANPNPGQPNAVATTPTATNTVAETPVVAPTTTTEVPAVTNGALSNSQIISNELAAAMSNNVSLAPAPEEAPPAPRIVQREGIVRGNTSIQSPTKFELVSPDNHKLVDYLFTTSTNLDLNRYKGLHIIVTGEEGKDERWNYTPVITIQKIQVLE